MKLKRAAFRHIEAEIHAYHDTLREIDQLRQDIIFAGRQGDDIGLGAVSGGYVASSTTERRATKLADSVLLREMERITGAIEAAYLCQKEECRRVLWVKYGLAIMWEPPSELVEQLAGQSRFDLRPLDVANIVCVDERTFYRYRTGFVHGVAEKLGWY